MTPLNKKLILPFKASSVLFLQCYDGTSVSDIQMVITKDLSPDLKRGDFIEVLALKIKSKGTQVYELAISEIKIISQPLAHPKGVIL